MSLKKDEKSIVEPTVIAPQCVGCGSCESVCPVDPSVFEIIDDIALVVNPEYCTGCDACVVICPVDAVSREG